MNLQIFAPNAFGAFVISAVSLYFFLQVVRFDEHFQSRDHSTGSAAIGHKNVFA